MTWKQKIFRSGSDFLHSADHDGRAKGLTNTHRLHYICSYVHITLCPNVLMAM